MVSIIATRFSRTCI